VIAALCPIRGALANSYYISYSMGSNSNPGTQALPWKTHPYMPSASACTGSGSAPTYAHTAGDRFIFRGGDIWPNACLPLAPSVGGSSGAYDYYGVDQTWYAAACGAAWCRPIIDSGGVQVSGNNIEFDMGKSVSPSYITVDNFEFRNHYWIGTTTWQQNTTILCPNTGALVENNYIHGWTHALYGSGATPDSYSAIMCAGITTSTVITANTISNSDQAADSGVAIRGAVTISNNTIHDVPNGILSLAVMVSGNVVYNINQDYDPTEHENCIETWLASSGTGYLIDNVCHDTVASSQGLEFGPNQSNDTFYWINNVFWNINWGPPALIDNGGSGGCGSGCPQTTTYHLWNNTFVSNAAPASACVRVLYRGNGNVGTLDMQNNHCITSAGVGAAGLVAFDSGITANTLTTAPVVVQTPSAATSQGYVIANSFRPTSHGDATVGAGNNLSSSCSGLLGPLCSDASGYWNMNALGIGNGINNTRTAVWDVGSYQFQPGPAPPTGLTAVPH
jgi:hypothetical protein